ncbi:MULTISPECIES: hypothetical protein [unclassified Pseudomonas]|uniref:hypothetical protein n=1 Tax=unclassified Pseudomonas TaxID=196821 RepID=UPI002114D842|nr:MULTISPECIES: hypothetical protein [unclassified Pseudomonas]
MYWIKTFGAGLSDFRLHRLPAVVERARAAIDDPNVVGYLLCALERPPRMTGLLFCDHTRSFPEGLPIHTPAIADRYRLEGYEVVITIDGGMYVVAHWLHENGALDRFDRVH